MNMHWTGLTIVAGLGLAVSASGFQVEFEDITPGTRWEAEDMPTSFMSDGVKIDLTAISTHGYATAYVETYEAYGVTNNRLWLGAGTEAAFDLGPGSDGGSFSFGDEGGVNFVIVNGIALDFDDLVTAPNGYLGSVWYNSSGGSMKLDGDISSFAFRGQELWIDRVTLNIIPEPASLLCLGLLGGVALRRPQRE